MDGDKYDDAIAFLVAHPDELQNAASNVFGSHPAACLFVDMTEAARYPATVHYREVYGRMATDPRIAVYVEDLDGNGLYVLAEYRREMDRIDRSV